MVDLSFIQGAEAGFNIVDRARSNRLDRQERRQQMGLRNLAQTLTERREIERRQDRSARLEDEAFQRRVDEAAARVTRDPDNASETDLGLLEQGGRGELLDNLRTRREQRGATRQVLGHQARSLRDMSSTPQVASAAGQPPAPAPAQVNGANQPQGFMAGLEQEEQLPEAQLAAAGGATRIQKTQLASIIGEDHPLVRPAEQASSTASAFARGFGGGQGSGSAPIRGTIEVPPEVAAIIEDYPNMSFSEQQQAAGMIRDAVGEFEDPNDMRRALQERRATERAGRQTLVQRWSDIASGKSAGQDQFFQLAENTPTAAVAQYARARADLSKADPNTVALMDRKMAEIVDRSITNIQEAGRTEVPADQETGLPDWNSEEAKQLKRALDQNIALKRAIEKDFSIAQEANIRGGAMPVGQAQLVDRVTQTWEGMETPAEPMSASQERLANTRMRRAAEQQSDSPTRRIPNATLDALTTLVHHGKISIPDAETFLRTGRFTQPMMDITTASPDENVYVNGRLVQRARASGDELARTRGEFTETTLEWMDNQFKDIYTESPETGTLRKNEFMTWLGQKQKNGTLPAGIQSLNDLTTSDASALFNQFVGEQDFINDHERGLFSWFRESGLEALGGERLSTEAAARVRERGGVAPDLRGRIDIAGLQQRMRATGDPALTSLANMDQQQLERAIEEAGGVEALLNQAVGAR